MLRRLLICAASTLLIAPVLLAQQQSTVCIFQTKGGNQLDADSLADALGTHPLRTVIAAGIARKNEDAEAQKRDCSWIVVLRYQTLPADSPNLAGTGDSQAEPTMDNNRPGSDKLLEYDLRKAGSRKTLAHGEFEKGAPFARMADQIARKISKGK
jgi:hypothetical protein